MRVTIIPSDSVVTIDGVSMTGIDMSGVDAAIHAIQWYGETGEVELKDVATGKMVANIEITNLNMFENLIAQFNAKKAEQAAAIAEQEAQQNVVEV